MTGAATLNDNTVLSIIADGNKPALTAASITFGGNAKLDIAGFDNSDFGHPVILIKTEQTIAALPPQYTLGGDDPDQVDYLLSQLRIGIDQGQNTIAAIVDLTWNDSLFDSTNNKYERAHGTFTIENGSFTLGAPLISRAGLDFETGWDGDTLTKKGQGTLVLTDVNTYQGTTEILAGVLALAVAKDSDGNVIKVGSIAASKGLAIDAAGTFDIAGVKDKAIIQELTGKGRVILGNKLLEVTKSSEFEGVIHNGENDGNHGSLAVSGADTELTLKGDSTYTGNTIVDAGASLVIKGGFAAEAGALTVNNNETFDVTGSTSDTFTFNELNGTGAVLLGAKDLTVKGGIFGGALNSHGNFIKTGDQTFTVSAVQNDFTGTVTVDDGQLVLDVANVLPNITGLDVQGGSISANAEQSFTLLNTVTDTYLDMRDNNLTLIGGNVAGELRNVNDLIKTGSADLTIGGSLALKGDLEVQNGGLWLENPTEIAGTLNVNGTLNVSIHNKAVSIIANSMDLSNGILNISGFSGDDATEFYTILVSQTEIGPNHMPGNYTIGNSPTVDYLSAQLRQSSDKKSVEAAVALTWYHESTNGNNEYDLAHGDFTVAEGGSFDLGSALRDRSGKFEGNAWDGKTLTKKGAGLLILSGENEHTGGTVVEEGTLRLAHAKGIGAGVLTNKAVTELAFTGNWDGTVEGNGILNKESAGTINYIGNSAAYRGTTNVNAGTLSVNGTLGGKVNVNADAVLGGNGTILGNVTVAEKGILAPGNSIDTLKIYGDLTMDTGAVYQLEIDRDSQTNDLVTVTGTANISGAKLDHIGFDGSISPVGRWTILTAHTLEGKFGSIESIYEFIDINAVYDDNKVVLEITRGESFTGTAFTKNQRSVSRALDTLTEGTLYNNMLILPNTVNFPHLYDLLSGEIYASVAGHVLNYDRAFSQALIGRSNDRRPDGRPLWVSFDGYYTQTDATGNTGKAAVKGGGITLGTELWLTDTFMLGFAFRYSDNDLEVNSRDSKADIESYNVGIYAGTELGRIGDGKLRFTLGGAYGYHNVDAQRSVNTFGQQLKADYDVHSAQFFAELGCRFELSDKLTLEPYGGVAWNTVWSEAFKEKGGYAALHSADKNNSAVTTSLGVRMESEISRDINVKADVSWKHTYGDVNPESRFAFTGSDKFTIKGAPLSRDALNINLGAQIKLYENTSLEAGYTGELGDRHQSHGGYIKFNLTF